MDADRLRNIEEWTAKLGEGRGDVAEMVNEIRRLQKREQEWVEASTRFHARMNQFYVALRILAGLPDDAGHTHAAELGDRHAAYARGVLAGAEALPVGDAVAKGEEPSP